MACRPSGGLDRRDQIPNVGRESRADVPKVDFVDDGPGKPIGINKFIGRRPILAFGNSDGDQQMLEWTAEEGARFMGLVHHTDAAREYAYDRQSKIGKLDKALDEAIAKGWVPTPHSSSAQRRRDRLCTSKQLGRRGFTRSPSATICLVDGLAS
jgi:hypothetical protein